jgi:hypothetical protein
VASLRRTCCVQRCRAPELLNPEKGKLCRPMYRIDCLITRVTALSGCGAMLSWSIDSKIYLSPQKMRLSAEHGSLPLSLGTGARTPSGDLQPLHDPYSIMIAAGVAWYPLTDAKWRLATSIRSILNNDRCRSRLVLAHGHQVATCNLYTIHTQSCVQYSTTAKRCALYISATCADLDRIISTDAGRFLSRLSAASTLAMRCNGAAATNYECSA